MKPIFVISTKFAAVTTSSSGAAIRFCWQRSLNNYICTYFANANIVNVYDRQGTHVDEVHLPAVCTGVSWDKDGDLLAMTAARSNVILLWDANTRRTTTIDSNMGGSAAAGAAGASTGSFTFISWSKSNQILAVGNNKGNLLLYDHQQQRKTPIIGKHTKAITCGAFNERNLLALGSDDSTITVSNALDGDTMYNFQCNGEPASIQFSDMKETTTSGNVSVAANGSTSESTISAIVAKKILMLINLNDVNNPINLQFQSHYGNIADYCWYGDGYILIGFSNGYVVCISTHVSEIGQEIFSAQDHKSYLSSVAVSTRFSKAISVGDAGIKIRELTQLSELYSIIHSENIDDKGTGLDKAAITDDGQLLAVSTNSGNIHVYLTKLPVLGDASRNKVAFLSSLTEVTVVNDVRQLLDGNSDSSAGEKPLVFSIDMEPAFVAVGLQHVAVGMNNRAWFYQVRNDGTADFVKQKEYLGTIISLKLNSRYAAALLEGKIQLHTIDSAEMVPAASTGHRQPVEDRENRLFAETGEKSQSSITCMALTQDFLIYGTSAGRIHYFYIDDWKAINEYRHACGIRSLFSEYAGSRLILLDEKFDAFIYNPVNDQLIELPDLHGGAGASSRAVLWDNGPQDRDQFVVYDNEKIISFIHYRNTIDGPQVKKTSTCKLTHGYCPLALYDSQITCLTQSGRTAQVSLLTNEHINEMVQGKTKQELEETFKQHIVLKRWHNAWSVCEALGGSNELWDELGHAALHHLDVEFAIRVFRQLGEVGLVWSLQSCRNVEDRSLLSGHLATLLEQFDTAERLYLESTYPLAALQMRRDLMHWDKALKLAQRLAPAEIPQLSKEYAQQLELVGDCAAALAHYEQGLVSNAPPKDPHNLACSGGIARMSIRLGDVRRGLKLAQDSQDRVLKKECAQILEQMKQFNEAASLYENGGFFDKAAAVYVRSKNWIKVGELLPKVHSPKIFAQYAKAMEFEGKYKLAVEAFKAAKDYENAVRVLLDKMQGAEEAVRIARETKSVEAAKLVAQYFTKLNDHGTAIQFLCLSNCHREAFELARAHDKMNIYADIVSAGDDSGATLDDYANLAAYFEEKQRAFLTGKFYFKCGQYAKALQNLIKAAGEGSHEQETESLKLAIDCVGRANDTALVKQLIAFLMGDLDGIPKDAKYLFRLYIALRMYREAAKTAVIIAEEEQNRGQYKIAHDLLFAMCQELKPQRITIPQEMKGNLMLLHSYILAKFHMKHGDHLKAARVLIRVAGGNISKFPAHQAQILTSTVIECYRAGLKNSAFKFAAMLLRPEYRSKIDEKYKKRIESIVRKPENGEIEEAVTPCLYCANPTPEMQLTCGDCKNPLPYCVITGRHMTKEDFALCPACRFPASYQEMRRLADSNIQCPMCNARVDGSQLMRLDEEQIKHLDASNEEQPNDATPATTRQG